jgi:hypothetical protein
MKREIELREPGAAGTAACFSHTGEAYGSAS